MKKKIVICLTGILLVAFAGCGKKEGEEKKAETVKKAEEKKPEEGAKKPEPPKPPEMEKLSASHILLMYKGSMKAPPEVTRTKEEAQKLAGELHAKLKAGAVFADVAKESSDCPTKAQGGNLGTFPARQMDKAFVEGVKKLKDGEFSEPVETPFGFHIIRRQEVVPPVKLSASVIVVMHKDSMPNPINATRTKEEALAKVKEAIEKLKGGADFKEIAKEYSDHPNKAVGGTMGNFESDRVPPELGDGVKALKIGGFSQEPIEMGLGFHILKREELLESIPMSASLMLVMHKDSVPNPINATRTKEEALARVKEAIEKLKGGADFGELAKEYSDHPSKAQGGDMGVFLSDKMMPQIVESLKKIKVGEFSKEPEDIGIGYHIFLRKKPDRQPGPPMGRPGPPGAPGGRPRPPGPAPRPAHPSH
ncbi:MAG: hypothetical protein GY854_33990 [Deltaproteobacteria bacterium]|nr:hypothetical protein [Deltaproteobacteria bacterium]